MGHLHCLARAQGLMVETAMARGSNAVHGWPWRRGLAWLALLGPFFFLSYGFATWMASRHPGVGVIVFDWERHIPFLPWTILPYWLIDLFYGISLLLFATRRDLDTHARRLLAAQLVAVTCFLLFPLRFSFERAMPDGVAGWLFAALTAFDQPFNQAPSLHIALLVILWTAYTRVMPAAWRWVVHGMSLLIGLSVLTTWQHHFFDIPTGLWLGWFCIWLFPDHGRAPLAAFQLGREPARRRLALRYVGGAFMVGCLAIAGGGAWLWLLWGSGSLGLVAAIYAGCGEDGFQKRADGSIAPAARWLLGPYCVAAWLNSRWWTRKLDATCTVVPGVLLGRIPSGRESWLDGVATVVDVCAELAFPQRRARYVSVPMLDLVVPRFDQIERASAAIEAACGAGPVLVCCALGVSRSALVITAWLLRTQRAHSLDEAVAVVRNARPAVVLGPGHIQALRDWQSERTRAGAAGQGPASVIGAA